MKSTKPLNKIAFFVALIKLGRDCYNCKCQPSLVTNTITFDFTNRCIHDRSDLCLDCEMMVQSVLDYSQQAEISTSKHVVTVKYLTLEEVDAKYAEFHA